MYAGQELPTRPKLEKDIGRDLLGHFVGFGERHHIVIKTIPVAIKNYFEGCFAALGYLFKEFLIIWWQIAHVGSNPILSAKINKIAIWKRINIPRVFKETRGIANISELKGGPLRVVSASYRRPA
jgi:hypothetical protein